jgi:hypothetical protein
MKDAIAQHQMKNIKLSAVKGDNICFIVGKMFLRRSVVASESK